MLCVKKLAPLAGDTETSPLIKPGQFIGKAWDNVSTNGKHYLRIKLDSKNAEVTLTQNDRIALVPNKKRDGKKDADYSLIVS